MVKQFIEFFSDISKDSWRDLVLSSLLIPIVLYLFTKMRVWLVSLRPLHLLMTGFRKPQKEILIFVSQLSGAHNQGGQLQLNNHQQYITRFPQPRPQNLANLGSRAYRNIDPVWTQSDGLCAAEVFNLLGQIDKHQGFRIADTVRDWNEYSSPIFSVGFNPKTNDLMNLCFPINFEMTQHGTFLSLQGHNTPLGSVYPADAGILQKTFVPTTKVPVFMLAGLGTTATEAAGKVLNENCKDFGKLYGSGAFCILFKTDITRGSGHYEMTGIYPKPKQYRALWYPLTFLRWHRKKIYPKN